jgi:hypothetical protein
MSPFVSQAQRAKFFSDPKLRKFAPEWEKATGKKKLPAYAKGSKHNSKNLSDKLGHAIKHLR